MPAGTFISVLTILGLALPSVAVLLLKVTNAIQPGMSDAWAVLGAMLASAVVVIVDGSPSGFLRSKWALTASFVSSAFLGSILPGVTVHLVLPIALGPDRVEAVDTYLTWHLWAAGGFVFGLFGWAIVRGIIRLRGTLTDRIEKEGKKYISEKGL